MTSNRAISILFSKVGHKFQDLQQYFLFIVLILPFLYEIILCVSLCVFSLEDLMEDKPNEILLSPLYMGLVMMKPVRMFGNNTGTDQPAHLRSLISAFVIRFFLNYHM